MDMKKFVNENQYVQPMLTKDDVLKSMQREMKRETGPKKNTFIIIEKARVSDQLAKDLEMDGLKVKDYEDIHSPFPQIKVDWEHLIK